MGNGTRDLPACSIVPQPTTLPCVPIRNPCKILVGKSKGMRGLGKPSRVLEDTTKMDLMRSEIVAWIRVAPDSPSDVLLWTP
jgi:hypothetical protein